MALLQWSETVGELSIPHINIEAYQLMTRDLITTWPDHSLWYVYDVVWYELAFYELIRTQTVNRSN